jgi:protein kinase X
MIAGYPPFYDESPFGIYQRILSGRIEFGRVFSYKSKDLIKKLLQGNPRRRYGCRGNGADDVKKHKWFKGVDWDMVANRKIPPPWVPQIKKSDDTHYFDRYPDSSKADDHIQVDQDLFRHF